MFLLNAGDSSWSHSSSCMLLLGVVASLTCTSMPRVFLAVVVEVSETPCGMSLFVIV